MRQEVAFSSDLFFIFLLLKIMKFCLQKFEIKNESVDCEVYKKLFAKTYLHHSAQESIFVPTMTICYRCNTYIWHKLDYCSSWLNEISWDQMYRLQKVQNQAAKAVFCKSRHEHTKALCWLSVKRKRKRKKGGLSVPWK